MTEYIDNPGKYLHDTVLLDHQHVLSEIGFIYSPSYSNFCNDDKLFNILAVSKFLPIETEREREREREREKYIVLAYCVIDICVFIAAVP